MKRGAIGSDIFLQSGLDDPNRIGLLHEITVLERSYFGAPGLARGERTSRNEAHLI